MNRYPLWKYLVIVVVVLLGLFYSLPNLFSEVPAVQIASAKSTVQVDATQLPKIEKILADAGAPADAISFDGGNSPSIRARFKTDDIQAKAKAALEAALNPDKTDPVFVVALTKISGTPKLFTSLGANPMYLGLDLRGGVHFLMQVDMKGVLTKRIDGMVAEARGILKDKSIRQAGIARNGDVLEVRFHDADTANQARAALTDGISEATLVVVADGSDFKVVGTVKPEALKTLQDNAIKQNISTLHNRVNQLGTSEPIIQQQGADRIVVELPGLQDPAQAKDIIGRTATLEVHLVDEASSGEAGYNSVTFPERHADGSSTPVIVKKDVVITGDRITRADPRPDENQRPSISISLDSAGGRAMRDTTRDNIGKLMAIVLFEKGKGEAISVARIQGEFGDQFRITGNFTPDEVARTSLLLRSGSLAAPMEIIEERSIGPSLGVENIKRGFLSTVYGFVAIAVFMAFYYMLFGLVSVIALGTNLLLLIALLSGIQTTLTLPGIAAIALALGMAIDSNVLINERIREELRNGSSPQAAIAAGYERAFGTILDSNITTLIAGLALLAFGSGAVRGFAVVHTLGIVTSIFSSVFVSRGIVNLIYGRKKKLASVSIGQVWKPAS